MKQAGVQCTCDGGYYGGAGGNCTPCAFGSYTPSGTSNQSACTLCPANTYDDSASDFLRIGQSTVCVGTLNTSSGAGVGMISPAGATCANITCLPGYAMVRYS